MAVFPFYRQFDSMDCRPTCLRMIAKYYGVNYSLQYLREKSYLDREGVSLRGISEAAETIGLRSLAVKVPFAELKRDTPSLVRAPLPAIAHWNQNHFIIVYRVGRKYIHIADPGKGKFKLAIADFKRGWISGDGKGVLLLLDPQPKFYEPNEIGKVNYQGFRYLLKYLKPH